jgi:hypothetical protein
LVKGASLGLHWSATPGAIGYLVSLKVVGKAGSETVVAWKPALTPKVASAALGRGHKLQITVRAIVDGGELGAPQSLSYTG